MNHLKTYKMFESLVELTSEQIEWLNQCTRGTTWQLNSRTGLVDVNGDFNCSGQELSDFKGVRFGVIKGYFDCANNRLTTLEGAPRNVWEHFDCANNRLTTLEGAPREVRWNFYCQSNQLTSLEGAPLEVRWSFSCGDNPVSEKILKSIFGIMESGKSYLDSVKYLWPEIPVEDQTLLYRPEFWWVGEDERRKLDALRAYQGFKGMI